MENVNQSPQSLCHCQGTHCGCWSHNQGVFAESLEPKHGQSSHCFPWNQNPQELCCQSTHWQEDRGLDPSITTIASAVLGKPRKDHLLPSSYLLIFHQCIPFADNNWKPFGKGIFEMQFADLQPFSDTQSMEWKWSQDPKDKQHFLVSLLEVLGSQDN